MPAAASIASKRTLDEEEDLLSGDNHNTSSNNNKEEERDEVKEVQRMSSKDTRRLQKWRIVVTLVLLLTALAVTLTSYHVLRQERTDTFETTFEQFSRTVADAAIEQRTDIRQAYISFANSLTAGAIETNATWPFYNMPSFELHAQDMLIQSRTEVVMIAHVVTHNQRPQYEAWATEHYEKMVYDAHMIRSGNLDRLNPVAYQPYLTRLTAEGLIQDINRTEYAPIWSYAPAPSAYALINGNVDSVPDYHDALNAIRALHTETIVTQVRPYATAVGIAFTKEEHDAMHSAVPPGETEHPHSIFFHPVHERLNDPSSKLVATLIGGVAWDASLRDLLPEGVEGIHAVVRNTCNQSYTYQINGHTPLFLGTGDFHEADYDDMKVTVALASSEHPDFESTPGHCIYSMDIYPSRHFEETYDKRTPEIFAAVVAFTFVMVAVVFVVYDVLVQRRNANLVANAAESNAIVSAVFPSNIRDRLIGPNKDQDAILNPNKRNKTRNLKAFMSNSGNKAEALHDDSKPLADLFLNTTVLFADVVGFTSWSSVREPSQVFILLERLYSAFDDIAKKRRVFKVETVGDCYVAVTGLPEARKDDAVNMARFAKDILRTMRILTKELEVTLGPDTGDLSLRVGIHSGPVTAGVLRGDRPRFQLFGDTVNTTARIESSGLPGQIHCSQETADLMIKSGKASWVTKRADTIKAKGKGDIQTYWITVKSQASSQGSEASDVDPDEHETARKDRLIEWVIEIFVPIIKQIVSLREAKSRCGTQTQNAKDSSAFQLGLSPLDEVKEIITLPEFDSKAAQAREQLSEVALDPIVIEQLRYYVTCIANLYRQNDFHNFEHASHVTMSVIKLLSRIIAPADVANDDEDPNAAAMHDYTYGITSDPMTQLACAFSALIHDVDHTGLSNAQLVKQKAELATVYNNRSVAEQNSLVLAWNLLLDEQFSQLRATICATESELFHFRELVVNCVLATDICDKDLKQLRNARWDKAFKETSEEFRLEESSRDAVNRKATIVIEHLIQASDVAHTMQHWHVYRKWNQRFFRECYAAYKAGHAETDPSVNWYKGEIGFFDFYIIPLAKKLKDCGVFGKSSSEYLDYALRNRHEWEARGQDVVAEMIADADSIEPTPTITQ